MIIIAFFYTSFHSINSCIRLTLSNASVFMMHIAKACSVTSKVLLWQMNQRASFF